MRFIYIFSAFFLFYCNECVLAKNVILIYDKADATTYDRDQLTTNVKNLSTKLYNDGLNMHFKIVFPYTSYIVEIEGSSPTKSHSNVYHIKNQPTFKSLLTQLRESPPHSVIFVITNITAPSDVTPIHSILEQIQIKRTEVNFVIEKEDNYQTDFFQYYVSITAISNGLVHSNSFKFNQFSDLLYFWLKSLPQKVNQIAIHHSDKEEYCITSDSLLTHTVLHFSANFKDYEFEMQMQKTYVTLQLTLQKDGWKAERIQHGSEGCFMIRKKLQNPNYPSFYNFRVFGKSKFDIDYGFSVDPVSSLDETRGRPIKGKFNRLYVTSTRNIFQATFHRFKIRFLNGTYFQTETRLHHVPETGLFHGLFEPPSNEYFFIEVTGRVYGEEVTRMSSTAMNAADQDEDNPVISESNDDTDMSYLNLKMIFLLVAFSSLAVVLLCQFFRYIECFTKTPEIPELVKSHPKTIPNIYQPVVAYKVPK